ncbi:MAG: hypothetical protein HRT90_03925 [Candidatus Margulisbacteria bacterium]|nr:hypothetical protein [Candidatus Margulisiibacteriota bacterium]
MLKSFHIRHVIISILSTFLFLSIQCYALTIEDIDILFTTNQVNQDNINLFVSNAKFALFGSFQLNDSNLAINAIDDPPEFIALSQPKVIGTPLAHPSPILFSKGGGVITYNLSLDMEIDFRVYNMAGQQIYQHVFPEASNGGRSGYNIIPFSMAEVGYPLPTSVYYFFLIYDGEIAARGKMAVIR